MADRITHTSGEFEVDDIRYKPPIHDTDVGVGVPRAMIQLIPDHMGGPRCRWCNPPMTAKQPHLIIIE